MKIFIITLLVLTSCTTKKSTHTPEVSILSIQSSLDDVFTNAHKNNRFNGNVLVTIGDTVLYRNSLGVSDPELKRTLSVNDKFGIGSIAKEFPAVAIMQLVEARKLSLNDSIAKHIKGLPDWGNKVTLKNLLQYSSGLPRVNWNKYESINDKDIFNDIKKLKSLKFPPGKGYIYSNNNPFLLMRTVEKVTGIEFSKYAEQFLFKPIGMNNTVAQFKYPYSETHGLAVPHNQSLMKDSFVGQLSSFYVSTIDDLNIWSKAISNFKLINKNSVELLGEVAPKGPKEKQAPLGRLLMRNGRIIEHGHKGVSGNFEAIMRRSPATGIGIVILTNRNNRNVGDLSEEVVTVLTSKK